MKEVLCAGYAALDLISYEERLTHRAGGTAANVAANLAFLGWKARLAGVLGADAAGRAIVRDLEESEVNVDDVELRSGGTPLVVHEIRANGHRFYFHCPECGRRFPKYRPLDEPTARSLAERLEPDLFFFDRASKATAILAEELRKKGTIVMFEPSTNGREFERCFEAADIFKYSSERASAIAELRSQTKPKLEIVTDGKRGVRATFANESILLPAFQVEVVDAAGAGDWTTAGLVWRLLDHDPEAWSETTVRTALRDAQALAAINCVYPGARAAAEHLTKAEMLAVARKLIADQSPVFTHAQPPRRTRSRATGCSSCLADA
ncbi:MAG TPA: PfkB family carbohydrate kinase [Kofleriaceae bacterium]|nr:PfkB family carbohydrate kinase [Kofleriaceae bacterium]